jgi:8-oxo-dGTP pyrophosphatase MutT (NUDIX family)
MGRSNVGVVGAVQDAVKGLRAESPREVEARWRFLVELVGLDDPFDAQASPVHVTGSGLVLGPRGTVLHVHRKLGRWLQPGGHVDPGKAPWDSAVRETSEETGLAVRHPEGGPRLVNVDVHSGADGHLHLDLRYLLLCDGGDPAPALGESQQVRWFSLDEAIAVGDAPIVDGLKRLRALAGLGAGENG